MGSNAIDWGSVLGIGFGALGFLAGVVFGIWGLCATRAYSRRKVTVSMRPSYELRPTSFGLGARLQMEYDGKPVSDLRAFLLTVRNSGRRDILLEIDPANRPAGAIFPSIEFTGLRIAGYHTVRNEKEDFYIALSKSKGDTKLWLNIEKIRRRKTAEFQIVCVPEGAHSAPKLEDTKATLCAGYVPNLEVKALGMLTRVQ